MLRLFKLIRNYFLYKKMMKTNESIFIKKFNLRKDWVGRYYTVINLSYDDTYGMQMVKKGLSKFTRDFDDLRFKTGLQDLIKIKSIKSIDAINYKTIIGYNNGIRIKKDTLYTGIILSFITALIAYLIYKI